MNYSVTFGLRRDGVRACLSHGPQQPTSGRQLHSAGASRMISYIFFENPMLLYWNRQGRVAMKHVFYDCFAPFSHVL